jgi:hypothetical protein
LVGREYGMEVVQLKPMFPELLDRRYTSDSHGWK